ncbi:hypothetical protein M2138_000192 [Dysgonomonadaceae bacterium PH5-43]|nr:hypothetical protein [Dysgonomonadaceae bacterium PH5-43]
MNNFIKQTSKLLICIILCSITACNHKEEKIPIKKLIATGQLWGFLKYHHPSVAAGEYDWDAEFINIINQIDSINDELQWKTILNNWVFSLPDIPQNTDKQPLENIINEERIKVKPNYGILFNPDYLLPETISKLQYILDNSIIDSNHYVSINRNNANLNITNENTYEDMLSPDLPYRLLSLFRYWNIVNYFFPYRDMCDNDWNKTLEEILPEFILANNQTLYKDACYKLATAIDDSHAAFNIARENFSSLKPPIKVKFIEDKLVVIGYTKDDKYIKDKIKIGDIITAIMGVKTNSTFKQYKE